MNMGSRPGPGVCGVLSHGDFRRPEILPTAWSFGQGLSMGLPGQSLARERFFIFHGDLGFSPFTGLCRACLGLHMRAGSIQLPQGCPWEMNNSTRAQVAFK